MQSWRLLARDCHAKDKRPPASSPRLAPLALIAWTGMAGAQPSPQLPSNLMPYFATPNLADLLAQARKRGRMGIL